MILSYGFSIIGSSHEKKGGICQDANKIVPLLKGQMIIAAVADGVGSCKYSDSASEIAVKVSTNYCKEEIEKNPRILGNLESILNTIEKAFVEAELAIEKKSLEDNQPLSEYDTTLDLVIFTGKKIFFGHCGDGGIIGLTVKGDYVKITSIQKKDGIYVVPLRDGSKNKNNTWEFDTVKEEFASVLLATDGVYDVFFPYLLKGQPVEIRVPLAQHFMDNHVLRATEKTIIKIEEDRKSLLCSSESESITDDKTVVVLINDKVMPKRKEASYYLEPDWDALQLEWNKKAYPHLYSKDEDNTKNIVSETNENIDTKEKKFTIKEIVDVIKKNKNNNKV